MSAKLVFMLFFYLSKILWVLISPLGLLFAALAGALVFKKFGRPRAAWYCISAAFIGLAIILFTPLDVSLIAPIENRFPVPQPLRCVDGIIVLGGGENISTSVARDTAIIDQRPMRYVILSDLMRRYPKARVIFTGGSGSLFSEGTSESDVAREIMERLGLDISRVTFETQSRNTWDNAVNTEMLARPTSMETWILLAPAIQMPRAIGVFRKIGWDVIPWPTDYGPSRALWISQNTAERLRWVDVGEHEWLGLVAYWLTSRSSTLFPGPKPSQSHNENCLG